EITYREIWQLPKRSGVWEAGLLRVAAVEDFESLEIIPAPPSYRLAKVARPRTPPQPGPRPAPGGKPGNALEVRGRPGTRVELWQADLTALGGNRPVDALLVSAFPNDYAPTSGSLIGALAAKGLSVAELATDKDFDIRPTHACWLSKPIDPRPGMS